MPPVPCVLADAWLADAAEADEADEADEEDDGGGCSDTVISGVRKRAQQAIVPGGCLLKYGKQLIFDSFCCQRQILSAGGAAARTG